MTKWPDPPKNSGLASIRLTDSRLVFEGICSVPMIEHLRPCNMVTGGRHDWIPPRP